MLKVCAPTVTAATGQSMSNPNPHLCTQLPRLCLIGPFSIILRPPSGVTANNLSNWRKKYNLYQRLKTRQNQRLEAILSLSSKSRGSRREDKEQRTHRYLSIHEKAYPRQTSAHHSSIRALIVSRISRVRASFSSWLPLSAEGSGKLQCNRFAAPGKTGQRSALVSSQTVTT